MRKCGLTLSFIPTSKLDDQKVLQMNLLTAEAKNFLHVLVHQLKKNIISDFKINCMSCKNIL